MLVMVNVWAVLVAALAAMVIGALWYSPIFFGPEWMRLHGVNPAQARMRMPPGRLAIEAVLSLVTAYILAQLTFAWGGAYAGDALFLGVLVWVGFYATVLGAQVVWEDVPLKLFFINAGLRFITILTMAAIVGVWR